MKSLPVAWQRTLGWRRGRCGRDHSSSLGGGKRRFAERAHHLSSASSAEPAEQAPDEGEGDGVRKWAAALESIGTKRGGEQKSVAR